MGIMTIVGKKIIVNSLIHKLKADPPSIVINVDEIYTTSYILYHWTLTVIQHVEMCHIMLQYLVMLYIQTLLVALNTLLIIWRVIHHTTL